MRTVAPVLLAVLAACAGEPPREPERAVPPPPARDSLALVAPGGVEVWYIGSRTGRDSAGGTCTERVMEIRRDGGTILIPLLYTGEAPTLANDSTLRTNLWRDCRPMRRYEVNLRTGRPLPK